MQNPQRLQPEQFGQQHLQTGTTCLKFQLDNADLRMLPTLQGSNRGSSPQIRTFAPDGKAQQAHFHHEATHTSSYPLPRGSSRSPSPHRAASLDIRSSSPGFSHISMDLRTSSPSQSSLTSLTGGSGSSCNSPVPASPRNATFSRYVLFAVYQITRG